jgi:hypothetical protein
MDVSDMRQIWHFTSTKVTTFAPSRGQKYNPISPAQERVRELPEFRDAYPVGRLPQGPRQTWMAHEWHMTRIADKNIFLAAS